jgi:predicted methyltransferase
MTVVEIWPGAGGWYTEILAPYLRDQGKLYAAHFNADSESMFYRNSRAKFEAKLQSDPALYSNVSVVSFNPPTHVDFVPQASVDRILTFRNIHNWYMRGGGDERVLAAFSAFYQALKPGGILGIVEHRLAEARPFSDQESSGYMHESYVIELAQKAGFKLLAQSNINANPNDSTMHPEGVWTLPPTLRLGDTQRSHYVSIGESDRMTLKLIKPEQQEVNK